MDETTTYRKRRLQALIARPPYNGSQAEFARAASLSEGRISQLLDPAESFGERSARNIANELRLDPRYFEEGLDRDAGDPFVLVRRVDVTFSNGQGRLVVHEDERPPLSFRLDFLQRLNVTQGNAVVVDAKGISNEPKIMDGAVVLLNRADKVNLNGDFFAFRADGELLIKRLHQIEGVGVLATSENPDYKPKQKVYTDMESFEVIGRAVWTGTEL